MTDAQHKELDAFFAFFATFDLPSPVRAVADLSDGAALYNILAVIDADYFRAPASVQKQQHADNWVLHFGALKRVYRLQTQYFADVLHQPTAGLAVPDLQALAKDADVGAALALCRLMIAIAVQCERNKDFIARIQGLSESNQHQLMRAIEQIMSKVKAAAPAGADDSTNEDDRYYELHLARSQALAEKETIAKVYQALLDAHRQLQTSFDDTVSERDDALARVAAVEREREADDRSRNDRADGFMRAEIDRLRAELQKSEDNLALTETELDKQTAVVADMTRRVDELQAAADEASRLKDQLDEYRHAADRLAKTENVMEKYKKKLQEGADLRQNLKSLEKQNAELVDKAASLEEEFRKASALKPLMDSYKSQVGELEARLASRAADLDAARFDAEQARAQLRAKTEEHRKDSEALELFQERVRELELAGPRSKTKPEPITTSVSASDTITSSSSATDAETPLTSARTDDDDDEDGLHDQSFGDELDMAMSGTTVTALRLQIRRLEAQLAAAASGDASRVLVLENLLEDATRAKARYEADYLGAHREKLVLQAQLEEIRTGKGGGGDGAEAAIALRQRLNETVEELDALKREHTALEVQHETLQRDLTIAKSDLTLVNKDQLDILASLRESVNEDKAGLESELARAKEQVKDAAEKNRLQLEQINVLLLEKVSLQSDGIGQRERMLALARDRDFTALRMSGALPSLEGAGTSASGEESALREQLRATQEKLAKAKTFIKSQHQLFQEEHARAGFGDGDEAVRARLGIVTEERDRAVRAMAEMQQRYRKEHELMLSHVHAPAMALVREQLGRAAVRGVPTSWLGQQRRNLGPALRR